MSTEAEGAWRIIVTQRSRGVGPHHWRYMYDSEKSFRQQLKAKLKLLELNNARITFEVHATRFDGTRWVPAT